MAKEIKKLTLASIHNEPHTTCNICGRGHPTHGCQATMEEVNVVGNYNFNTMGQKHPRFSWSSPEGTTNAWQQNNSRFQGALGFQNQQRLQFQPQQSNQSGLEDLIKSFIVQTEERLDAHGASIKELGTGLRNLEGQVGQIANILSERILGTLPADIEKNPKETLRLKRKSGKELKIEDDKKTEKKKARRELRKRRRKLQEGRNLMISIPNASLCKALEEDPYKEEKDRRDLSSEAHRTLLTLINLYLIGTSIKLVPLSIYKKLEKDIGEIRSVPISLQLADQTTITPECIVDDVLVRVDKFVFPIDFIVVNTEENKEVPLILEKPFLAMVRAILDIHDRKLMLRVGEETVTFEMNVATGVKPAASVEWKVKGMKEKTPVNAKDKCEVYPKKVERSCLMNVCTSSGAWNGSRLRLRP
ncbi:uncharacterized protein [Nicotiana sylvestris]|uniref:uncharacterized protein n=1 Tax=Nicotiana sylvestris TaxID=4096 RepID=UPI00388CD96E